MVEGKVKLRLKLREDMTIVGLFVTYPAVRETISLCYYIRKVHKGIGFPFSSNRVSID